MYLSRFGYLDPSLQNPTSGSLISGDSVRTAIIEFQAFAGLNQTGNHLHFPLKIVKKKKLIKKKKIKLNFLNNIILIANIDNKIN